MYILDIYVYIQKGLNWFILTDTVHYNKIDLFILIDDKSKIKLKQ